MYRCIYIYPSISIYLYLYLSIYLYLYLSIYLFICLRVWGSNPMVCWGVDPTKYMHLPSSPDWITKAPGDATTRFNKDVTSDRHDGSTWGGIGLELDRTHRNLKGGSDKN